MFAKVREIRPNTRVNDEGKTDTFQEEMYTRRIIKVTLIEGYNNWFRGNGYNYHDTWLDFNIIENNPFYNTLEKKEIKSTSAKNINYPTLDACIDAVNKQESNLESQSDIVKATYDYIKEYITS